MYRCELCKKVTPPGTKAQRVVVETRYKRYPFRNKTNVFLKEGKLQFRDDPGGEGREIVREVIACPDCAAQRPTSGFP